MTLEIGSIVDGKVTKITNFGAFIQIPEGKTGLVHISEVSLEYVKDIKTHLKENQEIKVKVLSIEKDGKIGLSIKKAIETSKSAPGSHCPPDARWTNKKDRHLSFEDKLNRFKKDSDERMQNKKKISEPKRNTTRKRTKPL